MRTAFKYRSGSVRDLKTLEDNEIYLPIKSNLNDPFEGLFDDSLAFQFFNKYGVHSTTAKATFQLLIDRANEVGVYSLSKNVTNELLWAHYGNQHYGFAIEYDLEIIHDALNFMTVDFIQEFDVTYQNTLAKIDFSNPVEIDWIKALIGTKSLAWEYEQEIRLTAEQSGPLKVPYCSVKAIYFGMRMDDAEKEPVMKALSGRGISYYNVKGTPGRYLLETEPLADMYINDDKFEVSAMTVDSYALSDINLAEHAGMRNVIEEAIQELRFLPYLISIQSIDVQKANNVITLTIGANYPDPFRYRVFKFEKKEADPKFTRIR